MKKVIKTTIALAVAGCAVVTNHVAIGADTGWIGGIHLGQSRAKIDENRITASLLGAGLSTTSMETDNRDSAFKLFGGYQFNKHFALESGYFDLGEFDFVSTTQPAGTLSGKIKLKGFNVDAVGIFPVVDKFSVFGRLGLNHAQAKVNTSSSGAVNAPSKPNPSKNALNHKLGLGAQYSFTDMIGLRGEWERYRIDDAVGNRGDINLFSLGVIVTFDRQKLSAKHTPEKTAPPKPVTVTAPIWVVVPSPARTEKYCSILDIQFEINQDDIQREEKEKLSVLGTFLQKYPDTTAVIEGHTDNVGTTERNMQLSQQRAQSVVNYLVDSLHISSSRLKAVGYGETRPLAENETETGKRQNRRIGAVIACATDIEGLSVIPARITVAMHIEFDQNKADIRSQSRDEIAKVAKFLKENTSVTATVEGHTGNLQTTPEAAMKISQQRAQNVVDELVENFAIARSRLTAEGFGQTRRFAYNTTLEGQQENRRVNVIINYVK